MNPFEYDFGYSWPYSHGHVIPFAIGLVALIMAVRFNRPRWFTAIAALVTAWSVIGWLIVHFALRLNLPLELPTSKFFEHGEGTVLDVGAGSGRASLMVLLANPQARVVALDVFSSGFGIGDNTPDRLLQNAMIAGVRDRIEARSADMREMPFEARSFDAAVSSYAIDHLRRADSIRALHEVHRVLRPGGEFLLEVMHVDKYGHTAFPLIAAHGFFGPNATDSGWRDLLQQAGFEILDSGYAPGTVYVLARKPS